MTAIDEMVSILKQDKTVTIDELYRALGSWTSDNNPLLEYFKENDPANEDAFFKKILCSNDTPPDLKTILFINLCASYLTDAKKNNWFDKIIESAEALDRIFIISEILRKKPELLKDLLKNKNEVIKYKQTISYNKNLKDKIEKYIYAHIDGDLTDTYKLNAILIRYASSHKEIQKLIFDVIISRLLKDPKIDIKAKIEILDNMNAHKLFKKTIDVQDKDRSLDTYNELFKFFIENSDILNSDFSDAENVLEVIGKHVFQLNNFNFLSALDFNALATNESLLKMMTSETASNVFRAYNNILEDFSKEDLSNLKISEAKKETVLALALTSVYRDQSVLFHELIYIDDKSKPISSPPKASSKMDVIYNNEGYLPPNNLGYQMGNPLKLDNAAKTPIGYNIYLPPGEIKHLVVNVYGGVQAKDLNEDVMRPGSLTQVDEALILNGVGVVYLNLNDLIELKVFQNEMPEDIHARLHESINKFYETIKTKPEALSPKLSNIKGAKLNLYGASFGGRTAVRHAELYPGTFDGYISHDGIIDFEKGVQSGSEIRGGRRAYQTPFLDPALPEHLKKLSDRVLILQNLDDNNVNAKIALSFINKAKKAGKSNLITLHTEKIGNPIPSLTELHNKGHFSPSSENDPAFESYTKALSAFIQNKPMTTPHETVKKAYKNRKIANKFYRQTTPLKRFIAESMLVYTNNHHTPKDLKNEPTWKAHYQPIADSEFLVGKLLSDDNRLSDEVERLMKGNLLTDEIIKRVLEKELPLFLRFFSEYTSIIIPNNINKNDILENKALINAVREVYLDPRLGLSSFVISHTQYATNHRTKLLTTLYETSPDILPDLKSQFTDYEGTVNSYKIKMIETAQKFEALKSKAADEKNYNQFLQDLHTTSEDTTRRVLLASEEITNPQKAFEKRLLDAIKNQDVSTLRGMMVQHGNLNFVSDQQTAKTPLTLVIESGNREMIDILLKKINDKNLLNNKDSSGMTALMVAAELGDVQTAKSLIAKGADLNLKSNNGFTAINYAFANHGKSEIWNILSTTSIKLRK